MTISEARTVHVYYSLLGEAFEEKFFYFLLQKLPKKVHENILRYHHWQDRQRSLIGKLLSLKALADYGQSKNLQHLTWSPKGRPMIPGAIDFNISHAGSYVVCAASSVMKVGIDIEKIKPVCLKNFQYVLSQCEKRKIAQSDNPDAIFFELWTKKESVLKATGLGIVWPLDQIVVNNNRLVLQHQTWYLTAILLNKQYACHLATSAAASAIMLKQVYYSPVH